MQRMLRHIPSGDFYIYTRFLAERSDMEEVPMVEQVVAEVVPEVVKPPKPAKPPKVENPVVPEFVEVQPEVVAHPDGLSELLESMNNQ